jgi:hypothetical protein
MMLSGLLFAASGLTVPTAFAWGAKAFYPTSVSPAMPDQQQAQRIAMEPPAIFRVLNGAHQRSRDLGWNGIGPAFGHSTPSAYDR